MLEHLRLDVDHGKLAARAQLRCHVQRLQAGSRADLEYLLASARLQQRVQAAGGQQRERDVQQPVQRVRVWRPVTQNSGRRGRCHTGGSGAQQRRLHRALRMSLAASQNAAAASGSSANTASATARY